MRKKLRGLPCLALLAAGALFLHVTKIGCVWKHFFGIRCPGCGMTHALFAALRGDFNEAFFWHPMFWSVPILIVYIIADGNIFKNKILNYAPLAAIFLGFAINWIVG